MLTLDPPEAQRREAQERIEERPDDPAAWLALSRACQALFDEEGAIAAARRAVELAPDDRDSLLQLATTLAHAGRYLAESRRWFERARMAAPRDPGAHYWLYYFALTDGKYRAALESALTIHEDAKIDPASAFRVARALDLLDDEEAARRYAATARDLSDRQAGTLDPFGPFKPVYAAAAGDPAESEALSEALCRERGHAIRNTTLGGCPPDTPERIARLRDQVAGRDILLFGFGPSLQQVTAARDRLAGVDFVSMTLSTFPVLEDHVLHAIGRRIDILSITHPNVLRQQAAALRERLACGIPLSLVMPLLLRATMMTDPALAFLRPADERTLWLDVVDERPPSPDRPLHSSTVNSLLFALPAAVLARPRRIFLFGFDGQARTTSYFAESDPRYNTPHRQSREGSEVTRAWLWWDSRRFNEIAAVALRHVALLHDIDLPPIYNVCPDSALEPFPRIDLDDCFTLLADSPHADGGRA